MSTGHLNFEHRGRGGSQDFELNLASIIDCLVVMISFILISTSFVSIGILDAGVAAAGSAPASAAPSPVNATVELKGNHEIMLRISGKVQSSSQIPVAQGSEDWNYEALTAQLKALKAQWPGLDALTLVADNAVAYKDVVKTMEVARRTLPAVLLGGF